MAADLYEQARLMRLTAEGYELSRDDQLELFLYPLLRNGRSTQDVSHWDFLRGINWLFEKSRLTRNVNRAIWQATIPLYWRRLHEWKGIPTNNENCAPPGYLYDGYQNKGEIDNENRTHTYGRVPVRVL